MTPHQTAALLFRGAACLLLQHKESQLSMPDVFSPKVPNENSPV
jgi:hypothetical protein